MRKITLENIMKGVILPAVVAVSLVLGGDYLLNRASPKRAEGEIYEKEVKKVNVPPTHIPDFYTPVIGGGKKITKVRDYNPQLIKKIKELAKENYKDVMKALSTPEEVAVYCTKILQHGGNDIDMKQYEEQDYWASFKRVHENKIDDCDGGAVAAAAILNDNGYPPYILTMQCKGHGHAVFLYRNKEGKFGSLGIYRADCINPEEKSVKSLVDEIARNSGIDYNQFAIFDISKKFPDFIDNDKNNDVCR